MVDVHGAGKGISGVSAIREAGAPSAPPTRRRHKSLQQKDLLSHKATGITECGIPIDRVFSLFCGFVPLCELIFVPAEGRTALAMT